MTTDYLEVHGFETSYNKPPVDVTPMTEESFARSFFFIYAPEHTDHRQFGLSGKEVWTSVRFYYFHDGSVIGMYNDYRAGKVFYLHGRLCDHDFVPVTPEQAREEGLPRPAHCFHVSKCSKCGYVYAVDSSD